MSSPTTGIMLLESQLAAILQSATRAQAVSPAPVSLLPLLAQAILKELALDDLKIWQIDGEQCLLLWQTAESAQGFQVDPASLRSLAIGDVESFPLSSNGGNSEQLRPESTSTPPLVISLSATQLVDAVRLVVAFVHPVQRELDDELLQLTEVLCDVRRRELLQKLLESQRSSSRFIELLATLHAVPTETELLQVLATDAVPVTGLQRISIARRNTTGGWSLDTSTGIDEPADRSEEVQRLCLLVAAAEKSNQETASESHALAGNGQEVVWPLSFDGTWRHADFAAIFRAETAVTSSERPLLRQLSLQAGMALQLLKERKRTASGLGRRIRQQLTTGVVALFLILGILSLFIIQAELRIRVAGQTLPVLRQEIFSPENAVVQVVHVDHGQRVDQGDLLCELYSDDLQVQRERTREQLVTTQARLAALQTISQRGGAAATPTPGGLPLSVEQAELTQRVESLLLQVELIEQQIASLQVRAPIAGEVLQERLREDLTGRPVQQGQSLLKLVATDGPWELKLRIPEGETRHVLQAITASPTQLPVSFVLETSPEIERSTTLRQVAATTDLDPTGTLSVQAWGDLDESIVSEARYGAGVLARIACGRKPLIVLMTRHLREFWAKYAPF